MVEVLISSTESSGEVAKVDGKREVRERAAMQMAPSWGNQNREWEINQSCVLLVLVREAGQSFVRVQGTHISDEASSSAVE